MTPVDILTALVVEDDGFQRRTLARMLRSMGVSDVQEAGDGKQALTLLQSAERTDLIVCDLDMPQMDGMEFLRHLGRADRKALVIISSAQPHALLNSVAEMAEAYGVRILGTIAKPVTLHALGRLIELHEPTRLQPAPARATAPSFSLQQIRRGLREKQFEPFFQPKVDLASGRVLGAEALARWRHPDHGVILPNAFIAPLEQSGDIHVLTLLMLEQTARACATWRDRGLELTASVNLSLVSLSDTTIAERITGIVRAAGLDPTCMILEVTETAAMTEIAPALENLTRLRMHGFGLSIDDYGTGFASLRQLTRVPFTELKIDQGFVMNCAMNASSLAIVQSSVEMARRLNLKSVGEGVSTQEDWDALEATGCDMAQGYFIAKPMPPTLFLDFCNCWPETPLEREGHLHSAVQQVRLAPMRFSST